jgi:hypothetical protein
MMEWISLKEEFPMYGDNVNIITTDGEWFYIMHEDHGKLWFTYPSKFTGYEDEDDIINRLTHWSFIPYPNQPERSKREDVQQCTMRCSEHCGNTVREAQ